MNSKKNPAYYKIGGWFVDKVASGVIDNYADALLKELAGTVEQKLVQKITL